MRKETPPTKQPRDLREAKREPVLVDLLGVGGEGAVEQHMHWQQQLQEPRGQ